jgi:hypothetical protein
VVSPQPNPQGGANQVTAVHMHGYIAASLTWVDDSLISALQTYAAVSGPQAALMAPTVTQLGPTLVAAGGSTPVGERKTPASELIFMSQGTSPAIQGHSNIPWFFPMVRLWASYNPPPEQAPQDGTLPMEAPS